jgi:ADP-ribosylglycohydrolase
VESLGGGWIAEEALAIGLFCALVARDFKGGVLLAVNHGGDSDSTGAIAGNLLGLIHGKRGIPDEWLERLELRDVIERVGRDLWSHFGAEERGTCQDQDDYPPW